MMQTHVTTSCHFALLLSVTMCRRAGPFDPCSNKYYASLTVGTTTMEERSMLSSSALRRMVQVALVIAMFAWLGSIQAGDLNPSAISIKLPDKIQWKEGTGGAASANLVGDPSKPGLYIYLNKWHPHHMSRPHFHPNDRYIYVISGTWWVGTGSKYDPDSTVAVPAGSYVTHFGKQIHYDGAKDEECVLEIVGQGPATSTPAEVK
jgi:hypothetical protein